MTTERIKKFYEDLLNLPEHKLHYMLEQKTLLEGAFTTIQRYGVQLTEEVFNIFMDVVNFKLEGNYDVEAEFETIEYNNLMELKSLF